MGSSLRGKRWQRLHTGCFPLELGPHSFRPRSSSRRACLRLRSPVRRNLQHEPSMGTSRQEHQADTAPREENCKNLRLQSTHIGIRVLCMDHVCNPVTVPIHTWRQIKIMFREQGNTPPQKRMFSFVCMLQRWALKTNISTIDICTVGSG